MQVTATRKTGRTKGPQGWRRPPQSLRKAQRALFVAERREGAENNEKNTDSEDCVSFPKVFEPVGWECNQLEQWKREGTFALSVERNKGSDGSRPFVFQEGPPTANGRPGLHHVLARTFKDLVCRWKTMEGYVVERKAGWDCHGLPVEREVEKKLGLSTLAEVESFGAERFNQLCAESVWKYQGEWEKLTERMGYWTDLKNRYVTLDLEFMESEWWALKQLWQKGFLKRGYKVLPYSPKTACTCSNRDVAEGYKEVTDMTCYVRFPLTSTPNHGFERASMLVWTSTPWTLPGNVLLAVNKDLTYVVVRVLMKSHSMGMGQDTDSAHVKSRMSFLKAGEFLVVAQGLLPQLEDKLLPGLDCKFEVVGKLFGAELVGMKYCPPFDPEPTKQGRLLWEVVHGDFVNNKTGTGIVHVAPMYGEDDHRLCVALGLDLSEPRFQHVVGADGRFLDGAKVPAKLRGLDVTCDSTQNEVLTWLLEKSLLCMAEPLTHKYPHCWRNKTHRLLYYAMDSWFLNMADPALRSRMQQLNRDEVQFAPEKVKDGRFGAWLQDSRDWCVSRRRTWGCPLPVWVCRKDAGGCGAEHCVGGRAELRSLLAKDSQSATLEDLHSTKLDGLTLRCASCSSVEAMTREPYVLDCWFDSGCAPFAQHYGREKEQLPVVDFVAEGQDQCRGWFYSLLAVSTTLFDRPAYKKCLFLGLVLDKNGQKMSKSLGNGVDPWKHFNDEGADAVRWHLLGMSAPWADRRFDADKVRSANQKFFCVLFNVSKWWHTQWNALTNEDKQLANGTAMQFGLLDRWVLSRLARVVEKCNASFQRDQFHVAVNTLEQFVNEDLSKTYVRLSRSVFAQDGTPLVAAVQARVNCLQTLRTVLLNTCRLVAPMAPFFVDTLHRSLTASELGRSSPEHSVHMASWPTAAATEKWLSPEVEQQMKWLFGLMEEGRLLHAKGKRPGRLPLARAVVSLPQDMAHPTKEELSSFDELAQLLSHELNVNEVEVKSHNEFNESLAVVQELTLSPHLGRLGSRFKEETKDVVATLESHFGSLHTETRQRPKEDNSDCPTAKQSKRQQKKSMAKKKAQGTMASRGWKGPKVARALKLLETEGSLVLNGLNKSYQLYSEDFHVSSKALDGFAVSSLANLVLDQRVNRELESMYLAKELKHSVNQVRKKLDKERQERGEKALGRVFLRVVVQSNSPQDPVLSEKQWRSLLQAARANPDSSSLEQLPSEELAEQCQKAAEKGLAHAVEVRGYGSCGGFLVFVQCGVVG